MFWLGHIFLFFLPFLPPNDPEADRNRILKGITSVEQHGLPGLMLVYGPQAFAVLTANDPPETMAAAARYGKGRVFAIAHGIYLDFDRLVEGPTDAGKLFRNVLQWAAAKEGPLKIGLTENDPELIGELQKLGHQITSPVSSLKIPDVDVLLWYGTDEFSEERKENLLRYVREGGGLLTGVCPWGVEQLAEGTDFELRRDLPANQLLAPMGMVFVSDYANPSSNRGYEIKDSHPDAVHVEPALKALEENPNQANPSFYLLESGIWNLPPTAKDFWNRILPLVKNFDFETAPQPKSPVGADDALARLAITWQTHKWMSATAEEIPKAIGADAFPGKVPASAERVTRVFDLSGKVNGWQSTGLYIPPGEVVEIHCNQEGGWFYQIGCHQDSLWHKTEWGRWPEITEQKELNKGTNKIASPYGGSLYFIADSDEENPLRVTVDGAVTAPHFVLDDPDSLKQWQKREQCGAPWAELEGKYLVLSVPSESLRHLEDPTPVIRWWDEVVRVQCELRGIEPPKRRDRFVADVQISGGYMHAGYPIMTHLDTVEIVGKKLPDLLNLNSLKKVGNWGYFHELGHNRQHGAWTFDGTIEVTCNLFTLYAMDKLINITPWRHPWLKEMGVPRIREYLADPVFSQWKRDPGLALVMYVQIQKEFGWEPFQKVFALYETLSEDDLPHSEQEKIDQWMVRMSRAVGHNLTEFFKVWGLPLGDYAAQAKDIKDLPTWLPPKL